LPNSQHLILVVSDGTGYTAENVTKAALTQFRELEPLRYSRKIFNSLPR